MTSLSKPINFYLHNDSVDLNSPQSFGRLHHTFLPALDCWATLLHITHIFQPPLRGNRLSARTDTSPMDGHFAPPGSTTLVSWCALTSAVLTLPKEEREGSLPKL